MDYPSKTTQYLCLIAGFLILNFSITIAYFNPAISYELSVYERTPILVWIGSGFSMLVALVFTFNTVFNSVRHIAILLGGKSFLLLISLPIIRGYYHVGEGDAMSHVGWVKDLAAGTVGFVDPGYPAVHVILIYTMEITGITIPHSFLIIHLIFVLLFVIFVPIVIRIIDGTRSTVAIGVFSAFLLLPINLISVSMHIHPTTQAILFVPAILYIFMKYVNTRRSELRYSLIFVVFSWSIILLHPQQSLNILLVISTVAVVQMISSGLFETFTNDKYIIIQTTLFGSLFWIWFFHTRFGGTMAGIIADLFIYETVAAEEVSQRGTSLAQLGTGIEELFLKLFFVTMIFCILAGILMIITVFKWLSTEHKVNSILSYLTFGFIPLIVVFFAYIVANVSTQYFRHLGFMMVIVTIFGAIFLDRVVKLMPTITFEKAIVLIFIILLVPSILVFHPSPYILQGSSHVSETQLSGYKTTFKYHDSATEFLNIRSDIPRYSHYHKGRTTPSPGSATAPDHFNNEALPEYLDEPRYLTVTEADRKRDVVMYEGLRYSHSDFQYLENDSNISYIHSNGGFDLFYVKPER